MFYQISKYIIKAAFRDKLLYGMLVCMALAVSLSLFLGSSAITETDLFAMVFCASGLRLVGVMGLSLFVIFYIRRSFDNKDIELLLSRPVSRISFVAAFSCAF